MIDFGELIFHAFQALVILIWVGGMVGGALGPK